MGRADEKSQSFDLEELVGMRERIRKMYLDNHPDNTIRKLNDELIKSIKQYEERYGIPCAATPVKLTTVSL